MYVSPRPPTFGSRLDFERAVLELKWLGKDDDPTVARIAQKYNFPPDFIRKGVYGLGEDDTLMGKSKWWPIIAQWNEQYSEAEYAVRRAIARRGKITWELVAFGGIALVAGASFGIVAGVGYAIPLVSIAIGLVIAMYYVREDWIAKVEEEIHKAEAAGYPRVGDQFEEFSQRNPLLAFFMFKRFSKERAPSIVVDPLEVKYEKDGPVPVFFLRENVDIEYGKRVELIEPGLRFVKEPFGKLEVALKHKGRAWGMQLLTVRVRNGNLALSKPCKNCKVTFRDIKTYRAESLPWLQSPVQEIILPDDQPAEAWGAVKRLVSYAPLTIGTGEEKTILLGYGLESTGDFYFATDKPRVMPIQSALKSPRGTGIIGSMPFRLEVGAEGIASVVSKEITLFGPAWNDLRARYVETKSMDDKKITLSMEN